jgi:hypothetical protein
MRPRENFAHLLMRDRLGRFPLRAATPEAQIAMRTLVQKQKPDRSSPSRMSTPGPSGLKKALLSAIASRQPAVGNLAVQSSAARASASTGRPLDPATRTRMEARFQHDFSHVRIHDGKAAAADAAGLNARAFTLGRDIYLGEAAPASRGEVLLAHELTHAVQADVAAAEPTQASSTVDALEDEAERVAAAFCGGSGLPPVRARARDPHVPLRQERDDNLDEHPRDAITLIDSGEVVYLGVVQHGRVLAWSSNILLSHEEFVRRAVGWEVGSLPEGASVICFGKEGGEIWALNSHRFHGNEFPPPADVFDALKKMFQ